MKKIIYIKSNKRLLFLLFLVIRILCGNHFLFGLKAEKTSLNLLLITIDTLRPDRLSCYSKKYLKTPNIEALAAKGVIFDRAFAHNPLTLPSHVNILLGATPLYHGVSESSKSKVKEIFLTLAKHLKNNGYSTGGFVGAFPLDHRFGLDQGFDVYDDYYPAKSSYEFLYTERKADKVIDAALGWLKIQKSKWFCWVHLWDPHAPYLPPEPFKSKFQNDPYSGEVAYADSELGRIFDYLEKNGLATKTTIILTGDHGESLGEHGELTHGYFAYNSTLWVPLILVSPTLNARRINDYVCHIDIFPTLCDILRIDKPSFLPGISLVSLINGKKIKKRGIYFESLDAYYNRGWAPLRGIIENGKKYMDSPIPEFYDLEADFDEKANLAERIDLSIYQKTLQKMKEEHFLSLKNENIQKVDRETQEKLKSLGYIVSPVPQIKANYGVKDDLKSLFPFHQKMDKAILLDAEGKKTESIKLLYEIIRERNDFVDAFTYLSHMYKAQGKTKEALKIMEEGFNFNPENYSLISGYGVLLVKEGDFDKAIELLKKSLTLFDMNPEVWNHLGVAYWRKGEYPKALEYYRKALALDNSDATTFSNLGALYLSIFLQTKKEKDHAQSMQYFKKATELDPHLALAYKGLGLTYRLIEKNNEAIQCWEKALELDPNDDFFVYNLGITHLELGNKLQALEYFKKYLLLKKETISPEEREKIEILIQKCRQQ